MTNSKNDGFDFSSLFTPEVFVNLAWWHFQRQIPDQAAAVEYLAEIVRSMGLMQCPTCGSENLHRKYGNRVYKCSDCKKRHSFTSGTVFEGIKLVYAWVGRIWLMDLGIVVSGNRFSELVGSSTSTAWEMSQTLMSVILNRMNDTVVATSGHFAEVFRKRSRETPARHNPVAEEYELESGGPAPERGSDSRASKKTRYKTNYASAWVNPRFRPVPSTEPRSLVEWDEVTRKQLFGKEREIYASIGEVPIHFDSLFQVVGGDIGEFTASLVSLQLSGLVTTFGGDFYARSAMPQVHNQSQQNREGEETLSSELLSTIIDVVWFVNRFFRGISRKHLQKYLALHWFRNDRTHWARGSFLEACLASPPFDLIDHLNYVTPRLVRISLVQ